MQWYDYLASKLGITRAEAKALFFRVGYGREKDAELDKRVNLIYHEYMVDLRRRGGWKA